MDERAPEQGRQAYERRAWAEACALLAAADADEALGPEDLERLAAAAYLTGHDASAVQAWTRAHRAWGQRGQVARAAQCGFWISFTLLLGGEPAQGAAWLARTEQLLDAHRTDCAARGYLLVLSGLLAMGQGATEAASDRFRQVLAIAERFGDAELRALGLLGRGQALVQAHREAAGVACLDQSMVAVTSGEVSAILAGVLYCAVILTCRDIHDLQRSQQWTAALDTWCAGQPGLVAFRGPCLVHRSEVLQLRGDWRGALEDAERACEHLAQRSQRLAGRAHYQCAELHRLRGELEHAEQMYREASRCGAEPQPGLSLLRLMQGQVDAAAAAIRRVVGESGHRQGPGSGPPRAPVLGACVEIMLAVGDLDAAREAAAALGELAARSPVPYLVATSEQAAGAVALASGRGEQALVALRRAWAAWQQLEAPYEAARVRVLIARACEGLGDADTASLHRDAARAVFERLGAAVDSRGLESPGEEGAATPAPSAGSHLSARERQVLAMVATGQTNKQIAGALHISEHTVARHLSGIFHKLGVSSRTAAGAFAFEHGLVPRHGPS